MPNMHGADKVEDPETKPKLQARLEGIPNPIPIITKSVSQPNG